MTEAEQEARRAWFRRHFESGLPFNRLCRMAVRRWDPDAVEMTIAYADELSAHEGVLHGGVLASLVDTCGTAAVLAGHDYTRGSRLSTSALTLQYLAVARGEDVLATGRCVKRGRTTHVSHVEVTGLASGRLLVTGQVVATVAGERPGLLE